MSTTHWLYEQTKEHYDRVTPIRGKRASKDIRPVGNRQRTHECVVKVERADGTWYGFRLYNTDVVLVSAAGVIEFNHGGWVTSATGSFMHQCGSWYSRGIFRVNKSDNKLWVVDYGKKYPLLQRVTKFQIGNDNLLTPLQAIIEQVPVIDRKIMKQYMEPLKPMINYIETVMKISNGFIASDTLEAFGYISGRNYWDIMYSFKVSTGDTLSGRTFDTYGDVTYEMLRQIATQGTTEDWTKVLCSLSYVVANRRTNTGSKTIEVKNGEGMEDRKIKLYDIQILAGLAAIRAKFASVVKKQIPEVWTSKPRQWA